MDPHSSNELQKCNPPKTAEGLWGFNGAYRFLSLAISQNAKYLAPLHKAVGDKSKGTHIERTTGLISAFKTAQEILKLAEPLTMPLRNEQLCMLCEASPTGIGATLHRECNKALIRHFSNSKSLSADKKRWLPCKLKSYAVGLGLQVFLPYFQESEKKPKSKFFCRNSYSRKYYPIKCRKNSVLKNDPVVKILLTIWPKFYVLKNFECRNFSIFFSDKWWKITNVEKFQSATMEPIGKFRLSKLFTVPHTWLLNYFDRRKKSIVLVEKILSKEPMCRNISFEIFHTKK